MSGHGTNPIFFDQKNKIRRQEHSLILHPSKFNNISFQRNYTMLISNMKLSDSLVPLVSLSVVYPYS